MRGTCESTHYIREDSLEQVVKTELLRLASYLDSDEIAFAELLERKTNEVASTERKASESALAAATARSQELHRFVGCIDLPSFVPKHNYKLDSRQGVAIEYLPSAV